MAGIITLVSHNIPEHNYYTRQEHMSRPKGGEGASDCVSDVLGESKFISNALPYMEWPDAGYFHWLSSDRSP